MNLLKSKLTTLTTSTVPQPLTHNLSLFFLFQLLLILWISISEILIYFKNTFILRVSETIIRKKSLNANTVRHLVV